MDIFSFLDVVQLYDLRYLSSTCFGMIEQLCEKYVRSCDQKQERLLLERNPSYTTWQQELFTYSDFESKQFGHLFSTWGDLAIKRVLFERAVPFCCTVEQIQHWKNNRHALATQKHVPRVQIAFLGSSAVGKTLLCRSMASDQVDFDMYNFLPTIGAEFHSLLYSFDKIDYKLHLWDTAGLKNYQSQWPTYLRGTNVYVFVIRLDNEESVERFMTSNEMGDSSLSAVKMVIATGKELKRDNRLSYSVLEFCATHDISYYECSLKDDLQPFYVLYSLLHHACSNKEIND